MHRLDLFPNKELIAQYRQVFSSPVGLQVMIHMLHDLGVFIPVSDGPEDVALKNYGLRLIQVLSGDSPNEDSIKDFLNKLMRQPLCQKEQ